jgi:hypothetical protein
LDIFVFDVLFSSKIKSLQIRKAGRLPTEVYHPIVLFKLNCGDKGYEKRKKTAIAINILFFINEILFRSY